MDARVLVVEDDMAMGTLMLKVLQRAGLATRWERTASDALAALKADDFDVVLTDVIMPGMNGIDFCQRVSLDRPDVPVVVMTAFGTMDTAVAAIRAGAYDFVTKPIQDAALTLVLERSVRHHRLGDEVKRLRSVVAGATHGDSVGESPALQRAFALLERIADSDAAVLVTGESGTGKELAARRLHDTSRHHRGPFVAVNCAAMPEHLLESELFGHVQGAFTDARTSRTGLFLQANGGTLFLDEIGELPLALQPKLLRALQERRVRPVGGDRELPFDARVVSATNRDLEESVEAGRFRQDLLFRINVIIIDMPPLRMRGNDVLLLAQVFLRRFAERSNRRVRGLSAGAAQKLLAYRWPGNVRELQNCMERAVALASFEQISVDDLPASVRAPPAATAFDTSESADFVTLEENERRYLRRVLDASGGNKSLAARVLGVDRKTLWRKLGRMDEPKPTD